MSRSAHGKMRKRRASGGQHGLGHAQSASDATIRLSPAIVIALMSWHQQRG